MKRNKASNKKKKANIPLRRKLAVAYIRRYFFIKITLVILLSSFFFTSYFAPVRQEIIQNIYEFTSDISFKLENVLIEGQYNTREEDILATLNADKVTPILFLDLGAIKNNLERNPWIKNVAIIERLPNTIYIRLIERIPIAIWLSYQQRHLVASKRNG